MTNVYRMPDRAAVDPAADGWPDIAPPAITDVSLPVFPANLLPTALGAMVEQTAAAIQAPLDIAGLLVLPIAASTLAGKVRFVGRADHCEHAMLWTLCIAASSERKTPVFERLRGPLIELAKEFAEQLAVDDEIRQTRLAMVEKQIEELKKEAEKAALSHGHSNLAPAAQAALGELIAQRRELQAGPIGLTEWSTSPTPEGLQRVMAGNAGRAAVFTDEGGLIGTLAGRYSGKDGADMDPFLSGFVGSPLRSPRAGSDRPFVDAAYLTMGLAVQPSVLDDLAGVKGAEERGLVARFLFAVSSSLVGTRMYGNSQPIDEQVSAAYGKAVKDWAVWPGSRDELVHLKLDAQAYRAYEKFHDEIEVRQAPGQDLAGRFAVSKIAGTTLRIAGLFHCFDVGRAEALRSEISEDATNRAIEMARSYFIPHALQVSDQMSAAGPQGVEARILGWIQTKGRREFKFRDLTRALMGKRGSVNKAEDLLEPVENLLVDGYLREVESGSKASRVFKANPGLFVDVAA